MLAQVLLVTDLESGGVHDAHDVSRAGELAVGEDVTVDEAVLVVTLLAVIGTRDRVIEHATERLELGVRECEVRRVVLATDVLGEPDRADGVELGLGHVAVVAEAHLSAALEAALLDGVLGECRLLLGERDADRLDAVVLGGVHDHAAPAAADVEQGHARLQAELAADEIELVVLGSFQ